MVYTIHSIQRCPDSLRILNSSLRGYPLLSLTGMKMAEACLRYPNVAMSHEGTKLRWNPEYSIQTGNKALLRCMRVSGVWLLA